MPRYAYAALGVALGVLLGVAVSAVAYRPRQESVITFDDDTDSEPDAIVDDEQPGDVPGFFAPGI